MKRPTQTNLIKQFRADFGATHRPLDFRRDVFVDNQYGAYPAISYNRGKEIVGALYDWAEEFLDENSDYYPNFGGWEYNTMMTVDSLRSSTVKSLIESVIFDLTIHWSSVAVEREKAYQVYLEEITAAEGNLISAAINADKRGFNWTVDYQGQWYRAISEHNG